MLQDRAEAGPAELLHRRDLGAGVRAGRLAAVGGPQRRIRLDAGRYRFDDDGSAAGRPAQPARARPSRAHRPAHLPVQLQPRTSRSRGLWWSRAHARGKAPGGFMSHKVFATIVFLHLGGTSLLAAQTTSQHIMGKVVSATANVVRIQTADGTVREIHTDPQTRYE